MPDLPDGTVTFLFTDIEGSTRLWENHPKAMRPALARHDSLVRDAIEQNNGHVFKTIGDAFCTAFQTASEALQAALAAQQALNSEPWPEPVNIRVRMALHTGAVESRDKDYFGQPLNRVARLLATGHGGQVLLSLATQELVRDALAPSVSLQAMGEHRLRDLNRPETLFQLLHPDLPSEFPPLKTLDYLPNNLPLQLTSFIGREQEIAEITSLLSRTRLLTLTGIGGAGKTRLSLHVAGEILAQYPDGVWLVELAPLLDPGLVPQTVASALDLTEQTGKTYVQTLIDNLQSKCLLLILDNSEHLLLACAHLSEALLRACPQVKILASSREALGVAGEQIYRVPSLSPDSRQMLTLENIGQFAAIRLFVERAASSKPGFVPTPQNASTLAVLCRRLDGIPLAIELAAARVRSLTVEEINTRLDNRFRLLTGGSKTAMPRQQTLRALIDWSYDLLSSQDKLLLVRLSVFSGGWTLEAAEQVGAGDSAEGGSIEEWEVLDLLTSLVDKSLVIAETKGEMTRYRLLETVRQYALDRMSESQDGLIVRKRHRDYFLALAEQIKPKLIGSEQVHWLSVLEEEHDNLRQAITFCLEEPEESESGLCLAGALQHFWAIRGHLSEGRKHLTAVLLRASEPGQQKACADALHGSGVLALLQSDYAAARTLHQESLAIYRELADKRGIANALTSLGNVAHDQGDYAAANALHLDSLTIRRELGDKLGIAGALANLGNGALRKGDYPAARVLYEEGLASFRELGHKQGIAGSLNSLGNVAHDQGDYTAAHTLYQESLTIERELGNKRGIANALNNLGNAALFQGDYITARALHQESLAIRRELADRWGIAGSLSNLGIVAQVQGDYAAAHSLYQESLTIKLDLGDKRGIVESLDSHAALAHLEQQATRAAQLWGAVTFLREAIGLPKPPNELAEYGQHVARTRFALGEAAFAAAFEEGRAMTMEQAVACALTEKES